MHCQNDGADGRSQVEISAEKERPPLQPWLLGAMLVFIVILLSGVALLYWAKSQNISPPELPLVDVEIPKLADSYFQMPLVFPEVGKLVTALNKSMPFVDEKLGAWVPLSQDEFAQEIKYKWTRTPFVIVDNESSIALQTDILYQFQMAQREAVPLNGQHWYREFGMPHGNGNTSINIEASVGFSTDWKPEVGLKITGLPNGLENRMGLDQNAMAREIQENIPQVDTILERRWNDLNQPIKIGSEPDSYLCLNPKALYYTAVHSAGGTLASDIALAANPSVQVGSVPIMHPLPLPGPILSNSKDGTFLLSVDCDLFYKDANKNLMSLQGMKFSGFYGAFNATIESAKIWGRGNVGIVELSITGFPFSGKIYLSGAIKYDELTCKLWIAAKDEDPKYGLDFSAQSKKVLGTVAGWLLKSSLLNECQKRTKWNLAPEIGQKTKIIETAFFKATDGSSSLEDVAIMPKAVYALKDQFKMIVVASGKVHENR